MADDFEYDVFLSHSTKDKGIAREIAERLREDRLPASFDGGVIRPGECIPSKVEDGVQYSARSYMSVSECVRLCLDAVTVPRRFGLGSH